MVVGKQAVEGDLALSFVAASSDPHAEVPDGCIWDRVAPPSPERVKELLALTEARDGT